MPTRPVKFVTVKDASTRADQSPERWEMFTDPEPANDGGCGALQTPGGGVPGETAGGAADDGHTFAS